ncbi:MAG: hypothetical protein WCL51_04120 [Bacteroidota bacterium]
MNDIFNAKRFTLLLKEQSSKNLKLFLMGAVLIFAVLFALDLLALISTGLHTLKFDVRLGFYGVGIFPTAFLLSSTWFTYLSNRAPESGNLLLPVSAFERILVAFIINVIVFSLIYFLIVLSIEILLFQHFEILYYFTHFFKYRLFYISLFLFQSFFLFGSLVFKKAATIKTGFVIFIGFIILQLINNLVMSVVFRNVHNINYSMMFFNNEAFLITPLYIRLILLWIIYLGFPLMWIASYFKLKEKQV